MKALRIALIVLMSLVGLLVLMLLLLFLVPAVPTWLVTKAVSSQPGSQVRIDKIDLDWNGLALSDVHVLMENGPSVSLQTADLRVQFLPLLRKEIRVDQAIVSGLVLDLTRIEPKEEEEDEATEPFHGALTPLRESGLRLFVDGIDVTGKFFLPQDRSGDFTVTGGDIAPGATGIVTSKATIRTPSETTGEISGLVSSQRISVTQDEEGIQSVAVESLTLASGPAIAGEARIFATAQAAITEDGERYQLTLRSAEGEPIAEVDAAYTAETNVLSFSYQTRVGEATVAALGFEGVIPPFSLRGSGKGSFTLVELNGNAMGELSGSVALQNEEFPLPPMAFTLGYDVSGDSETVALRQIQFEGSVGNEQALRVKLAPDLVINLADPVGSLPNAQLAELYINLPLQLLSPEQVRDGRLQGLFQISKLQQALSVQSTQPLQLSSLMLAVDAAPSDPLSLRLAPSLTFDGKQLDFAIGGIVATLGSQQVMDGLLQGKLVLSEQANAPLSEASVRGNLNVDLDAVFPLLQPEVAALAQQGKLAMRFSAAMPKDAQSLSGQFNANLSNVIPPEVEEPLNLRMSGTFEADLEKQTFYVNAPISLAGPVGRTELTGELQVTAAQESVQFGAALTGPAVYADDLITLSTAYVLPASDESAEPVEPQPEPEAPRGPDSEALWTGFAGEASTSIDRIVFGANEITNFRARVSITPEKIELSHFQAALAGEPVTAAFSLAFNGPPQSPYVLHAQFDVTEFDLGAVDQELRKEQPPLVEGLFTANGRFQGSGPDLESAAEWIEGSLSVEAKKATYYPLGNFKAPAVSGIVGAASQILPGLLKDKGHQGFAVASQQIFSLLQGVETEHLVMDMSVGKGLKLNIGRFELLSSQLSFEGNGSLDVELTESPMRWPFNLHLKMGAKGNAAHLFNEIGALNPQQDAFGYYTTKIDFPMGGRIGLPTSGLGQSVLGMAQSFMNPQRVELPEPDIRESPRQEAPPTEDGREGSNEQKEPDPLNLLFDLLNKQGKKQESQPQGRQPSR